MFEENGAPLAAALPPVILTACAPTPAAESGQAASKCKKPLFTGLIPHFSWRRRRIAGSAGPISRYSPRSMDRPENRI